MPWSNACGFPVTAAANTARYTLFCVRYGKALYRFAHSQRRRLHSFKFSLPLIGKEEEKAFKENQIREIKKEFLENFKVTPAFLEFDTFENILKSSGKENLKEWRRLLCPKSICMT